MIVSEETAAKSLLSAAAVRERAHKMLALGDGLPNFRVDLARLDDTAQLVIDTTRAAYPTLDIPFHSRWRHFDIDGFDYWDEIDQAMAWPSPKSAPARRSIWRLSACCSMPARGRTGNSAIR